MATVGETLELYEKALDIRTSVIPRQEDVISDLDAFIGGGYKSSNAASTLEQIKRARQSYRDELSTPHTNAQRAAGTAFDTLSSSEKAQVNATSTLRLYNNTGSDIVSNNASIDQKLAKADELLSKQTTQTASTTNADANTQDPAPAPAGDAQNPKQLTGTADEDNGQGQENPAESGAVPSAPTSSTDGENGTTQGSDQNTEAAGETEQAAPGKRLKNPLGNFSSYTYQISLYMITPDAYDAFIASGRRRIDALNQATGNEAGSGGAFLIAQSGGINNTSSARAPGFTFDYYIDNLSFKTSTNAKSTETATNATEFKFQITEPYGFSFITKLKQASEALAEYARATGNAWSQNPSKQFFILGIRFFGYDQAGNIITGQENYDGNTLDPNAVGNGLFETYYDILLTSIKFKIDGRATTYDCTAASLPPQSAFTVKRGLITSNKEVTAATVNEAILQLFQKLNDDQQKLLDAGTIMHKNEYKVRYIGDAREIAEASLVTPEDLDKFKWPGSGAKTTTQSTDAAEVRSNPDNTKRTITFSGSPSTPILQAINNIIAQSSYLRDALQVVYTTALEPDPDKKTPPQNEPKTKKAIKWYNCSSEISNAKWDEKVGDWAYTMTYIIQTYETPVLDSSYANPGKRYYGPHKRYEYWYTGKNSEVLAYVQNLDNTYFNVALATDVGTTDSSSGGNNASSTTSTGTSPAGSGNATTGPTSVARVPNQRTSQPRIGKLGIGMEAQNNYLTSLYDPGAYATAKITILGDPDFLVQDSAGSENQIYNRFYGTDGFTVNPNGGQVFIEIDFKEAVDYVSNTGTLNINESILFWKYPENISKQVKGVSYLVKDVTSTFSNGAFKQVIDAIINDFGDPGTPQEDQAREPDAQNDAAQSPAGPAPSASNASTASSGLKKDNPSNQSQPATPPTNAGAASNQPQQPTTPTNAGPVADDDGQG